MATRHGRAASNPAVSAFVAANAGSGKTHVLAQRVIRLLLRGTAPQKILCLTYTKAAAANMANRVFGELAKWTPLSDDELDKEILKIEGHRPTSNSFWQAKVRQTVQRIAVRVGAGTWALPDFEPMQQRLLA